MKYIIHPKYILRVSNKDNICQINLAFIIFLYVIDSCEWTYTPYTNQKIDSSATSWLLRVKFGLMLQAVSFVDVLQNRCNTIFYRAPLVAASVIYVTYLLVNHFILENTENLP